MPAICLKHVNVVCLRGTLSVKRGALAQMMVITHDTILRAGGIAVLGQLRTEYN